MADGLDHTFSPLQIGSTTVPNRLFVSAHNTNFLTHDPSGFYRWTVLSERAAHYHGERARGGFGLIIAGQCQVHPSSGPERPAAYRDEAIAASAKIAEAVHLHGAKIFMQLNQNGREKMNTGTDSWEPAWGPSALAPGGGSGGESCTAMTLGNIRELVDGFATSARKMQEAGLDGVEVHAAHSHMLGEWLIPAYNRRTDDYGGSLQNRLRIVFEILDAIRAVCGRDFTVGVRMNGEWRRLGGQSLDDSVKIAKLLQETGHCDFIDVSAWPGELSIATAGSPSGQIVPLAEAIKRVVDIPVFVIGRILDPAQAEKILAAGQADMVGMTRASIADPELPKKAREGRGTDIRRCVGAGQGCLGRNTLGKPITCTQNPVVGMEAHWGGATVAPTASPQDVLVVGGGPAGMQAAIVAAQRGNRVTLWERSGALGGQVRLKALTPRHQEFANIIVWRERQLESLGVEVRLGMKATAATVARAGHDVVVVATGAKTSPTLRYVPMPHLDHVPGADSPGVHGPDAVFDGQLDGAKLVAVVDAVGYYQASDAVEYLVSKGVVVVAVTHMPRFATDMIHYDRSAFLESVRGSVEFRNATVVTAIEDGSLSTVDIETGVGSTIDGLEGVVLAVGSTPSRDPYPELMDLGIKAHIIGDAVAPRRIEHAVYEGHQLGMSL